MTVSEVTVGRPGPGASARLPVLLVARAADAHLKFKLIPSEVQLEVKGYLRRDYRESIQYRMSGIY